MAGATYDIVVLSSSPPPIRDVSLRARSPASLPEHRRVAMPPVLAGSPSPLASSKKNSPGALILGSRTAPIPEGVTRGFATARSVLADISITDRGLSAIEEALESRREDLGRGTKNVSTRKPRKPRKEDKKTTNGGEDTGTEKLEPKPRGRKPKASNTEQATGEASNAATETTKSSHFAGSTAPDAAAPSHEPAAAPPEPKTTKARKPRARKSTTDDGETQTTLKAAKVTKPRARAKSSKKAAEKATEVVSAHFQSHGTVEDVSGAGKSQSAIRRDHERQTGDSSVWDVPMSPSARSKSPPKQQPPDPNAPLDLDEAVSRRRDWTPPLDTERQEILISSTEKENRLDALVKGKGHFTSLLSGYTYAHINIQPGQLADRPTSSGSLGTTKRRRVELLNVPGNQVSSRQSSPEKGKAPKKKPRTITNLVTGQYAPQDPLPESPAVTSDFFACRSTVSTKTTRVPLSDTKAGDPSNPSKKPARKRPTKSASEKGEGKGKSKKASAKPTAAKPKLVAHKLLSPTSAVHRMNKQDILFGTSSQLALEESPTMVREIQKAIRESEEDADLRDRLRLAEDQSTATWPRLQRIEGGRALWAASARDDDGQTLEKQNDVYMAEPDRTQDFPLLMGDVEQADDVPQVANDSFLDIDDFAPPLRVPIPISSPLPTPPPTIAEDQAVSVEEIAEQSSSFLDIDNFPQNLPPSNQKVESADSSFLDIDDFVPPAQAATEPRPQVTSAGSPKKRTGRPLKSQSAIPQTMAVSAPIRVPPKKTTQSKHPVATSLSTPKRTNSRFRSIDEILDSEDDGALSPTPPRTRRLEACLPLPLTSEATTPTNGTKDDLVAVYCIPESHLTFDVLRQSLFPAITSLIHSLPPTTNPAHPSWQEKILMYDAIVIEDFTAFLNTHDEIRMYRRATQKQIKAWNKDLKASGNPEMKADEGLEEVLAVKREIEGWMAQKWCEDMSVCCVSREGRRGGVRKGMY